MQKWVIIFALSILFLYCKKRDEHLDKLLIEIATSKDEDRASKPAKIKSLLGSGAQLTTDMMKNTLFHYAAAYDDLTLAQLVYSEDKSSVNSQNIWGIAPIHVAAYFGSTNVLKMLLANRANDNEVEGFGCFEAPPIPGRGSYFNKTTSFLNYFLEHPAYASYIPHRTDKSIHKLLQNAKMCKGDIYSHIGWQAIDFAIINGQTEAISVISQGDAAPIKCRGSSYRLPSSKIATAMSFVHEGKLMPCETAHPEGAYELRMHQEGRKAQKSSENGSP